MLGGNRDDRDWLHSGEPLDDCGHFRDEVSGKITSLGHRNGVARRLAAYAEPQLSETKVAWTPGPQQWRTSPDCIDALGESRILLTPGGDLVGRRSRHLAGELGKVGPELFDRLLEGGPVAESRL